MSRKVLITGASGYVGGRIRRHLATVTDHVLYTTSRDRAQCHAEDRCRHLDLASSDGFNEALEGIDTVIHLAALDENMCREHPQRALEVNTLGTFKLLHGAIRAGVRKFVYFSTIHVYGSPLQGTLAEDCCTRPVHPYAYTHRAAEDFILAAHDQGVIDAIVIRMANAIGPPTNPNVDRWTLLVNDLCRQAVTDRRMVLRSDGLQWRDFIALQDVARATVHLMNLPREAYGNGIFNLGAEKCIRVVDMVDLIAQRCQATLGYVPQIQKPPPSPGEAPVPFTFPIHKLKSTGFTPECDLALEIDGTLEFCRDHFLK